MLRSEYSQYLQKINISEEQEDKLVEFIENDIFSIKKDSELIQKNMTIYNGIIDVFNEIYHFIIGEGESKDMFYEDLMDEAISISKGRYPATSLDPIIQDKINLFRKKVKEILTESQFKELVVALKELFITSKKVILLQTYRSNNYQLGHYKTQKELLIELEK